MSPIHNIRNWVHAHHMHLDRFHMFGEARQLMHNPAFWLIIALLLVVISLITLGVLFGGGNAATPYPPTTYPWPIYP